MLTPEKNQITGYWGFAQGQTLDQFNMFVQPQQEQQNTSDNYWYRPEFQKAIEKVNKVI
jgi:hypothetical protein